jgi:ribosome-binding ATPase YchF (GTP1/OBG family)
MATLKQQNTLLYNINIILIVIVLAIMALGIYYIYYITYHNKKSSQVQSQIDKVCINTAEYNKLLQVSNAKHVNTNAPDRDRAIERDVRVLKDPLYPALNRSEKDVHNSVVNAIDKKQLYNTTREFTDTYRMVAYVTNVDDKKDSGGNVWKLMARQKNRNQADFYLIPANNNYDMKIMLNNDILVGNEKLRDIYTIPNVLNFKSPLLNDTPYEVTEIPMTDFTNSYN